MKEVKYWQIAYRDIQTHKIVGPIIAEIKSKIRPGRYARMNCPAGCEFTIFPDSSVDEYGLSSLEGTLDSVLQAMQWERKGR